MDYRGLKWLKFNFVIHPTELEELLNNLDYFIAVTNQRVKESYEISYKTSIFKQYRSFYEKIISGQKWDNNKGDRELEIHNSITASQNVIKYEPFQIEENGVLKTFKSAFQLEPVINITTFCLVVDSKDKLSVAFFEPNGNSNLGLQINYPKEIYNFKTGETINTENLSTFKLYTELINSIKGIGKKAKAIRKGKISRPNFWLSEKARSDINNNYSVKSNLIKFE